MTVAQKWTSLAWWINLGHRWPPQAPLLAYRTTWPKVIKVVLALCLCAIFCSVHTIQEYLGRATCINSSQDASISSLNVDIDLTSLAVVIAPPYQTIGAQCEVTLFFLLGTSIGWAASVLTFYIVASINQLGDTTTSNAILFTSFLLQIWCSGYIKTKFPGLRLYSWTAQTIAVFTLTKNATVLSIPYDDIKTIVYPFYVGVAISQMVNLLVWPETAVQLAEYAFRQSLLHLDKNLATIHTLFFAREKAASSALISPTVMRGTLMRFYTMRLQAKNEIVHSRYTHKELGMLVKLIWSMDVQHQMLARCLHHVQPPEDESIHEPSRPPSAIMHGAELFDDLTIHRQQKHLRQRSTAVREKPTLDTLFQPSDAIVQHPEEVLKVLFPVCDIVTDKIRVMLQSMIGKEDSLTSDEARTLEEGLKGVMRDMEDKVKLMPWLQPRAWSMDKQGSHCIDASLFSAYVVALRALGWRTIQMSQTMFAIKGERVRRWRAPSWLTQFHLQSWFDLWHIRRHDSLDVHLPRGSISIPVIPHDEQSSSPFEKETTPDLLLRVSTAITTFFTSPAALNAFQLTICMMFLALPAFLPQSTDWFQHYNGQWALISVTYVLAPTSGSSTSIALYRTMGTIIGALFAMTAWYIAQNDPYIGCIGLLFISPPASYLQVYGPYPRVGLITNLTYVIVYFNAYNQIRPNTIGFSALIRTVDVTIGVFATILVSRLIFPFSTPRAIRNALAVTTRQSGALFHHIIAQLLSPRHHQTRDQNLSPEETVIPLFDYMREMRSQLSHCDELVTFLPQDRYASSQQWLTHAAIAEITHHLTALEAYLCHMFTSAQDVNGKLWDAVIPTTQSSRKDYGATVLLLLHTYSTSIEHRVTLPPYLPSAKRAQQRLLAIAGESIRDLNEETIQQGLAWLHWNAYMFGLSTVMHTVGDMGKTLSETFGQFAYAAIPEPGVMTRERGKTFHAH